MMRDCMKIFGMVLIVGALSLGSFHLGWLGREKIDPVPVQALEQSDYQKFKKAVADSKEGFERDKAAHPEAYAQQKAPGDQWAEERELHPEYQVTGKPSTLDAWPNDAEKEDQGYLICCDQQGHFYAKLSTDTSSFGGFISADGKRFIKQKYCFMDSGEEKPTYKSCLSHFAFYGNLDNHSMYE